MQNIILHMRTWREFRNFAWHRLRSHDLYKAVENTTSN